MSGSRPRHQGRGSLRETEALIRAGRGPRCNDFVRLEDFVRQVPNVEDLVDTSFRSSRSSTSRTSRTVLSRLRSSDDALADAYLDDKELYLGDHVLVLAVLVVEDLADPFVDILNGC